MEVTEELLDKISLNEEQKKRAFDAACIHAGQQHKPCLAMYAKEAVRALKIIEVESGSKS